MVLKAGRLPGRQGEGECTCTTHSGLNGQEREWLAAVCAGVCCCKVAWRPSFTGRTCGANFAAGRRTFPFARSPLGLDQILAVQLCSCEQKSLCATKMHSTLRIWHAQWSMGDHALSKRVWSVKNRKTGLCAGDAWNGPMCSHRGMTRASKSGQAGGEGSGRGTPDPAPCSKLRPHGAPPVERFAPTHREGLKTFPLSHRDRGLSRW